MEIASLVISILSIVISAIVAGIPFYRKPKIRKQSQWQSQLQ